jgi:two-component system LytT family response regulator
MIRALIIDDEKPSREVLENFLKDYCEKVEVVATASSIQSGYKAIKKYNPELVFLDIELGDGKGFDLLQMIPEINFSVIFVTAYSEYAVKAFRYSAVDYLLKPVKIEELKEACRRAGERKSFASGNLAALSHNLSQKQPATHVLVIPHIKGFDVLKTDDIIMCRADGYCTNFHLIGGKKVNSSKNLKYYEELLSGEIFQRVHHSYIVNLNHITGYTKQGEIMLIGDQRAMLGDVYKEAFLRRFIKKP